MSQESTGARARWRTLAQVVLAVACVCAFLDALRPLVLRNMSSIWSMRVVERNSRRDLSRALATWCGASAVNPSSLRVAPQALALVGSGEAAPDGIAVLSRCRRVRDRSGRALLDDLGRAAADWASGNVSSAVAHGRAAGAAPLLLRVARIRADRGQFLEARRLAAFATQIAPSDELAWTELATTYLHEEHWDEARAIYEQAFRAAPASARLYRDYGTLLNVHYRPSSPEVEAAWTKARDLEPRDAGARLLLAHLYVLTGRPALALDESRVVVALDPRNPYGYWFQGVALLRLDHATDAVKSLEMVRSLGLTNPWALVDLARAYAAVGDCRATARALDELARRTDFSRPEDLGTEIMRRCGS